MGFDRKAYYEAHKEKLQAQRRESYQRNKEKCRERQKKYDEEHRAKKAEYYRENKERIIQRVMDWQEKNPEKHKEADARYRKAHKEQHNANNRAYYQRKKLRNKSEKEG
ncbi:MAG: hypothetical protein IKZ44_06755 [Clostridia bacterium]|nr:hypothetical protein [Clostridia bacterium]